MKGFSKAIIAGNLVRDPEMRATASGTSVLSFSVAVNRNYKNSAGESVEETSYIDCTAWGKVGEIINQYLKKGDPILVSGRLNQRRWEDKDTGKTRSAVEIVVEDFNFIGSGNAAGATRSASTMDSAAAAPKSAGSDIIPDDIPEGDEVDLTEVPF